MVLSCCSLESSVPVLVCIFTWELSPITFKSSWERVSPFCRQGGEEMLRMALGPKASCRCAHTPPCSMGNGNKALRLLFPAQPHGRAQGHPLPCHQTAPLRLVLWSFISQTLFLAKFRRSYQTPPKVVENRRVLLLYLRRKAA